jgi:hypothetical protein
MNSETYLIKEDKNGAITVWLDQVQINSIPLGIAGDFQDLIPQRTFTHIVNAKYFSCDNGTEHGYYFTDTNQYVAPHVGGVRLPMYRQTTQAHVQARNDSLSWIVPQSGEQSVITFYDDDPGGLSVGVASPSLQAVGVTSPQGWQVNQTQDSEGSPAWLSSALSTAGGYDSQTADGIYIPARTPNVFISSSGNLAAGGIATIGLYTAPAGLYWRLQELTASGESQTGTAQLYLKISDGASIKQDYLPMKVYNTIYHHNRVFAGVGMKASGPGSSLNIGLLSTAAAAITYRIAAQLYVGP